MLNVILIVFGLMLLQILDLIIVLVTHRERVIANILRLLDLHFLRLFRGGPLVVN